MDAEQLFALEISRLRGLPAREVAVRGTSPGPGNPRQELIARYRLTEAEVAELDARVKQAQEVRPEAGERTEPGLDATLAPAAGGDTVRPEAAVTLAAPSAEPAPSGPIRGGPGPEASSAATVAAGVEPGAEATMAAVDPGSSVPGAPSGASTAHLVEEAPGRYTYASGSRATAEVGRGGMGRVLLAVDQVLGREVALKELGTEERTTHRESHGSRRGASRTSPLATRFLREARVTGQLEHPNIVPVYELGERPDGSLYYTMKYVRGRTLARALGQCRAMPERLALLPHYVDLCQAIAYAHSRGVVHRDIKTENVMVGEFGETVVLDWGLAKVRGEKDLSDRELVRDMRVFEDAEAGHTVAGSALGTPSYMSPEQAEGRIEEIDERSDVYSLGAVLFEILTGRPPFVGRSALDVIEQVKRDAAPLARTLDATVPPELSSICARALARDRADRYASAKLLADEVQAYQSGARVTAYEYSAWELLRRVVARHRALTAAAGLILILVVAGTSLLYRAYRQTAASQKRTEKAHRQARAEQVRAEVQGLLAEASRHRAQGGPLEALALLRAAARHEEDQGVPADRRQTAELFPAADGRVALVLGEHTWGPQSVALSEEGRLLAVAGPVGQVNLWDVTSGRRQVLRTGAIGPVACLALAPDGRHLATSALDSEIRIWELPSGRLLHRLQGHEDVVFALAFSPDGRQLASGSVDRTARVWDPARGRLRHTLEHRDSVWIVAFSPDGRRLLSAGEDGLARLWEVPTGRLVADLAGHQAAISAAAFSPDGQQVVTGSEDRTARLWEVATGRPGRVLAGHEHRIHAVAFSPDGRTVATGSEDRTARLWDGSSGAPRLVLRERPSPVLAVAFRRDGVAVATAHADGRVLLVDAASGRLMETLEGHERAVPVVRFVPPVAGEVLTASRDGTVRLWAAVGSRSRLRLAGHEGGATAVVVAPDGQRVYSAGKDGLIRAWSAITGAVERSWKASTEAVLRLELSGDGRLLLSTAADEMARLWDLPAGRERHAWKTTWQAPAALSPSGEVVAVSTDRSTTRLFEVRTGRSLHALPDGDGNSMAHLRFSGDGRILATRPFAADSVTLWSTATGTKIRTHKGPENHDGPMAFSPDGTRLAVAGSLLIRQLDLASGRELHLLRGHEYNVSALTYSPDGRVLASASGDRTVRLWDARTGRLRRVLEGHAEGVEDVRFSADGRTLVTIAADATARLWNAGTGVLLHVLAGHRGPLTGLGLAPSGDWLVTSSRDGTARIWDGRRASPADRVRASGARFNLRICRDRFAVVPVLPFPAADSVWAPASGCGRGSEAAAAAR